MKQCGCNLQAAVLSVSMPVLPFHMPDRVSRLLGLEAMGAEI